MTRLWAYPSGIRFPIEAKISKTSIPAPEATQRPIKCRDKVAKAWS